MTTSSVMNSQPRQTTKRKGVVKKVLGYLQDQAVENSTSRSYLTPPGLEPHQKLRSHPPRSRQDQRPDVIWAPRRLSDATTAVETRQQIRRHPAMGNSTDESVFTGTEQSTFKEAQRVQYAQDNILQNYKLYVPQRDPATIRGNQYWILYVHGGYFRDPKVDATSFGPALEILTANERRQSQNNLLPTVPESATPSPTNSRTPSLSENNLIQEHIAGYASINYRLAPHPAYPQDDQTEEYVRRNAHFPQQVDDIHAAIRHLQTRHDFTDNYILAGHSVGATLAFLAALKSTQGQIDRPTCIVGLNGIYDFPHIHALHPEYEPMTRNAMRPDQYREASPALYPVEEYDALSPKQSLQVLLSHSRDDGLVDWDQAERMADLLRSGGEESRIYVEVVETKGQHDSIWKDGVELARTLGVALGMVTAY